MKNSKAIILNLKDEYTRCIIPDLKLEDRGWNLEGTQRDSAKFEGTPRLTNDSSRTLLANDSCNSMLTNSDNKTVSRRQRTTITKFTLISKKKRPNSRRKYKKKTRKTGIYR